MDGEHEPTPQQTTAPTAAPPHVAEALREAAGLDWKTIDLDLPQTGFVCAVGAVVIEAATTVKCDCGTDLAIVLDGESRARCPTCKAVFRHALLLQREDLTPATPCLLIEAMLEEAGLRG